MYRDELVGFKEKGVLSALHTAFSRDQAAKVYVQNLLEANGAEVYEHLKKNNAHLYVCGDARNMARDVNHVLIGIAETHGKLTNMQATEWVKELRKKKRYLEDVWS